MTNAPFRPEHFARIDEAPDSEFYASARLVVHVDDGAIAAIGHLYAELLPPNSVVFDLMSSWRSHIPDTFPLRELVGLGMNDVELQENPRLTDHVVQDLNDDPRLPFASERFDGAILTVSVQYLTRPLEVFAEVYRVLRFGAPFIVTFSNRCFPSKAVEIWRAVGDREHLDLVGAYFRYSAAWSGLLAVDGSAREAAGGDPVFAVHAIKPLSAPVDIRPSED